MIENEISRHIVEAAIEVHREGFRLRRIDERRFGLCDPAGHASAGRILQLGGRCPTAE